MIRATSIILFTVFCAAAQPAAQVQDSLTNGDLQVFAGTPLDQEYEEMLQKYLVAEAVRAATESHEKLNAAQSPADFEHWQTEMRRRFLELIGGLPSEKTPLNVRLTDEVKRDGYTVRKITYESRPEFYVTANLYVPTTSAGPFPAVLVPCGHYLPGKSDATYQRLHIGLAKRGYVVLAYDAVGQGERMQLWDFVFQHRGLVDKSSEHGVLGLRQMLLGQNLARDLIWDGMRGLDYLDSLPEVDASRIGVTGNSGGGALTTYISLLDPRVKAASIVTFISSLPKKIEARDIDSEADPEQDIQGLLGAGIDHAELVAMIAPRPVMIGAAVRDFFPIEGTRETYSELQQLYERLGAAERLKMAVFDHEHFYSQLLREATTAWFDRWLKGQENEVHEPPIAVEQESTLWCTPTGQVASSFGGKRLLDFDRAEAERLTKVLATRRAQASFRRDLELRVRDRLGLPSTRVEVHSHKLNDSRTSDVIIEKLLLETGPGIVVPTRVLRSHLEATRHPAVVYLRDRDALSDDPCLYEALTREGWMVVVADVRGFGETMSHRQVSDHRMGPFHPRDGKDADFAYAALSLGRPLLGMRVWDALHVLEYTHARDDVDAGRTVLVGRGWAGLTALFAAFLDKRVSRLATEGVPASYAHLFDEEMYAQPASLMLPGALRSFDLEDVYGALAPRPLLLLNPEDAQTRKMYRAQAASALEMVDRRYQAVAARGHLQVAVAPSEPEIEKKMLEWIGASSDQRPRPGPEASRNKPRRMVAH